jgi:peroxin-1
VLAKKLTLDNGVMLDQIAAETDGFSGADLQAVLYNAHLEVVHSSIASQGPYEHRSGEEANEGKEKEKGKGKGKALENGPSHDINQLPSFRQLAPATEDFSGTERAALASRVSSMPTERHSRLIGSDQFRLRRLSVGRFWTARLNQQRGKGPKFVPRIKSPCLPEVVLSPRLACDSPSPPVAVAG